MKEQIKKVYSCDFCKKKFFRKHFAEKHEETCYLNPLNFRKCLDCGYLTKKNIELTDGYHWDGSERTRELELFYCAAKNIFLHTPQSEIKRNVFDLGDVENVPMFKDCDAYVYKFDTLQF